jgi:hypothetical protein
VALFDLDRFEIKTVKNIRPGVTCSVAKLYRKYFSIFIPQIFLNLYTANISDSLEIALDFENFGFF